jgi:hypothetical protein
MEPMQRFSFGALLVILGSLGWLPGGSPIHAP